MKVFVGRCRHVIATLLLILLFVAVGESQSPDPDWQRITTGEEFTIDIDSLSLVFQPDRVVSARFRTILGKAESLASDPTTKYKTRLETMQFSLGRSSYRFSEIQLLDSKGKVVQASAGTDAPWRPIRGSAGSRVDAIRSLEPFHVWKVVAYRWVDGSKGGASDVDVEKLLGTTISIALDRLQTPSGNCLGPIYESRKLSDADLEKMLGTAPGRLGFAAAPIDVVSVKCPKGDWKLGSSIFIPVTKGRAFFLLEGVFLELTDDRIKPGQLPGIKINS